MKLKKPWNFQYVAFYLTIIVIFIIYDSNGSEYPVKKPKSSKNNTTIKYILLWALKNSFTFDCWGSGRQVFINGNCSYKNCFVTFDRNLLNNSIYFDVIAFDGVKINQMELPQKRSLHQKYVFVTQESAANYPINQAYFDDFFNWTSTYKLDSDLFYGYMYIQDARGNTIGPKKRMRWMKHRDMLPASNELRKTFAGKTKTAAWFVSNCNALSERQKYVDNLNSVLQSKYRLTVDIYGNCGKWKCHNCNIMIKRHYFFYLAFENSFSEDYVTEKLYRALECNAIPVVYGGANYTRFLPHGSYLDARVLGVEKLAMKMYELINDFEQYADYFKWTNHYQYKKLKTNYYCDLCALLNDEKKVKKVTMYKEFRKWWNNPQLQPAKAGRRGRKPSIFLQYLFSMKNTLISWKNVVSSKVNI